MKLETNEAVLANARAAKVAKAKVKVENENDAIAIIGRDPEFQDRVSLRIVCRFLKANRLNGHTIIWSKYCIAAERFEQYLFYRSRKIAY